MNLRLFLIRQDVIRDKTHAQTSIFFEAHEDTQVHSLKYVLDDYALVSSHIPPSELFDKIGLYLLESFLRSNKLDVHEPANVPGWFTKYQAGNVVGLYCKPCSEEEKLQQEKLAAFELNAAKVFSVNSPPPVQALQELWPQFQEPRVVCESSRCRLIAGKSLWDYVIHLNDIHELSREEIADHLDEMEAAGKIPSLDAKDVIIDEHGNAVRIPGLEDDLRRAAHEEGIQA